MSAIQTLAKREQLTVGEWVRRTVVEARKQKSVRDPAAKLAAIRRAVEYSPAVPAVDIDQMLREIEQGRDLDFRRLQYSDVPDGRVAHPEKTTPLTDTVRAPESDSGPGSV